MSDANQKARNFRALHVRGQPLVLFNIWDAGTAKAAAKAGARAIATGSWSVATANGFDDGEQLPLDLAIGNLARIVASIDLPVTIDIESGYGKHAADVARTIERTIRAGAIGCNLEDSFPENGNMRDVAEQVDRIRHARKAAEVAGIAYFINARTDVFFQASPEKHNEAMVKEAIERAVAYAEAGADGIFTPGLIDGGMIARIARASPLPLNIMVGDKSPALNVLAEAGVARVSHGPGPYMRLMKTFEEMTRAALTPERR